MTRHHIPSSATRAATVTNSFIGNDDMHFNSPYHAKLTTTSSSPSKSSSSNFMSDYITKEEVNGIQKYRYLHQNDNSEDVGKTNTQFHHSIPHQQYDDPHLEQQQQHHHHRRRQWTMKCFFERGTWVHVANVLLSILAIINFGVLIPVSANSSSSSGGGGSDNINNNNIKSSSSYSYNSTTNSIIYPDEACTYDDGSRDYQYYYYYYSGYVPLCTFIFWFGFIGIAYDNFVSGIGKYVINTHPQLLMTLTRYRFVWHAAGMPLFCIPITIIADYHNLIVSNSNSISTTTMALVLGCIAISIIESMYWIYYFDKNKFVIVDLSKSNSKSKASALAGTISYSINETKEIIKLVIPVVVWAMYNLVIGLLLIWRAKSASNGREESMAQSGYFLVLSSLVAIITGCINKPIIQLFGEVISLGVIWMAFQAIL